MRLLEKYRNVKYLFDVTARSFGHSKTSMLRNDSKDVTLTSHDAMDKFSSCQNLAMSNEELLDILGFQKECQ